jgi:hypothetical protein
LRDRGASIGHALRQPVEAFLEQPGLACAGGRDDADQVRSPLTQRLRRCQVELRQIGVAADYWDSVVDLSDPTAQLVGGYRRSLAAQLDVHRRAQLEAADRSCRTVGDEDGAGLGRLLEPCRGVDGVAGNEEVARIRPPATGYHLAGRDGQPDGQAVAKLRVVAHAVAQLQSCRGSPSRVVAVRRRQTEHSHHGVTNELLDQPAVRLDHFAANAEEAGQQRAHVLWV